MPAKLSRTAITMVTLIGLASLTACAAPSPDVAEQPSAEEASTSYSAPASAPPSPTSTSAKTTSSAPSETGTASLSASVSASPTATSRSTTATAGSYRLTDVASAAWGNGFNTEDGVTIQTTKFAEAIVGSYPSSSTNKMNTASWALKGLCTSLTVSVGQDASSPDVGGSTHFIVFVDGAEKAQESKGPYDQPTELTVDVTGGNRLELLDLRTQKDGHNVWGSPRIACSQNPSPKK